MNDKLNITRVAVRPDMVATPTLETDSLTIGTTTVTDIVDVSDGSPTSLLRAGAVVEEVDTAMADAQSRLDALAETVKLLSESMESPDSIRNLENQSSENITLHGAADLLYEEAHLTYLMNPNHFERKEFFRLEDSNTEIGRKTIVIPGMLSVAIKSSKRIFILLDTLTLEVPAQPYGTDHYIYACDNKSGSIQPTIVISSRSDAPVGYTTDTSRKIGGFHTLVEDVGTAIGIEHTLYDWKAGSILPNSIWDLNFCPATCSADGMVYDPAIGRWVDIYISGYVGNSLTSSILGENMTQKDLYTSRRLLGKSGKELLDDLSFMSISDGSPEQANMYRGVNQVDLGMDFKDPKQGGMLMVNNITTEGQGKFTLVDTIRGTEELYLKDITPSVDSTGIVDGYTKTGFITGDADIYADANGTILHEIFHCTETLIGADGTIWKYNPLTGFGFCKYIGNGLISRTLSNPTGKVPGMLWTKNISNNGDWMMYLKSQGPTKFGMVNSNAAFASDKRKWYDTEPTTEAITLGHDIGTNGYGIAWTKQTQANTYSGDFYGIVSNGSILVVIGGSGEIQSSPDGITWTKRTQANAFGSYLIDIVWNGSIFVAVGSLGEIQTSPDAITWTHRDNANGFGNDFQGIAWNGSIFVAVGTAGEIQTSPDGITWTVRTPDNGFINTFFAAIWSGTQFIIAGRDGEIQTSIDGITWVHRTCADNYVDTFRHIAISDTGMIVIVGDTGEIQTSPDGITWTKQISDNAYASIFQCVAYAAGLFILTGSGGEIQTSPDGITWTHRTCDNTYVGFFRHIIYHNDLFIAVGDTGEIQTGVINPPDEYMMYGWFGDEKPMIGDNSVHSLMFTSQSLDNDSTLHMSDIFYANGLFVTAGQTGEIQTSPDGITWTKRTCANGFTDYFAGVSYGNGLWVLVGYLGEIQTSPDGINWTHRVCANGFAEQFRNIYFNGTIFVAVGQSGEIQTSPDGINWTHRVSNEPAVLWVDITWGDNQFVIGGSGGVILTSPDGITWTKRTPANGYVGFWMGVTYGNGLYVLVGSDGEIQTSPDGITWTHRDNANGYTYDFGNVMFADGIFLATGTYAEIQTSIDGINWIKHAAANGTVGNMTSVAHDGSKFVLAGNTGTIQTGMSNNIHGTDYSAMFEVNYNGSDQTIVDIGFEPDTVIFRYTSLNNSIGAIYRKRNKFKNFCSYLDTNGEYDTFDGGYVDGTKIVLDYPLVSDGKILVVAYKECADGYMVHTKYASPRIQKNTTIRDIRTGADYKSLGHGGMVWSRSRTVVDWMRLALANEFPSGSHQYIGRTDNNQINDGHTGVNRFNNNGFSFGESEPWGEGNISHHYAWKTDEEVVMDDTLWHLNRSLGFAYSVQKQQNKSPHLKYLTHSTARGIAYGNGLYVVMSNTGKIKTSPDGITWTNRVSPTEDNLNGIAFGNGMFVIGNYTTAGVITSPDGITWTLRTTGITQRLLDVSFVNGMFVAGGFNQGIFTSPDGITWTTRTPGAAIDARVYFRGAAYNGTIMVLVGHDATIQTSPDGITWTNRQTILDVGDLVVVVWTGTMFIAAGSHGNYYTSPDGITWTAGDLPIAPQSARQLVMINGDVIMVGDYGSYAISSDFGTTWHTAQRNVSADKFENIIHNGTDYLIATTSGVISTPSLTGEPLRLPILKKPKLAIRRNLNYTASVSTSLNGTAYGYGIFVSVGNTGEIQTSPDGINWIKRIPANSYNNHFSAVVSNGSVFITVGYAGEIQTSPDGITWTKRTPAGGFVNNFLGAYSNGSLSIILGNAGEIQTSPDGTTWTKRTPAGGYASNFYDAVWNGSIFCAVGNLGEIQTSPDGITWTHRDNANGYTGFFRSVVWSGSLFIAVGQTGEIQTSPDGITWTKRTPAGGYTGYFFKVTFAISIAVLVGESGEIQTSPDGITWTKCDCESTELITHVTYGGIRFVAIGVSGEIQTSHNGYKWYASKTNTKPFYTWYDGCPVGKSLMLERDGAPLASTVWNDAEPGIGELPFSNVDMASGQSETHGDDYLNLVWFEPDDTKLAYHGIFTHTYGTPSSIATGVTNPVMVLIHQLDDTPLAWTVVDNISPGTKYQLNESDVPYEYEVGNAPITFNNGNIIIRKNWLPTGDFLIMVMGEDEANNFKAMFIDGKDGYVSSGGHISEDGRRLISNIGVEDATGYLWQLLKDTAGYSDDNTKGWTWDAAGNERGYTYDSNDADSYALIAAGPSGIPSLTGTEGRRGDVLKTDDSRVDVAPRGSAKTFGKCPY